MSCISICRPRTHNVLFLPDSVRTKLRRPIRRATIFIIGAPGTGKKTLAFRFSVMNQGPFEREIQSWYYYTARIDLDNRRFVNGSDDVVLTIFIIPPPSNAPELIEVPPIYMEEMYISTLIFLCSVIDVLTFGSVISTIKQHFESGLPHFLVVGNMVDLNRADFPLRFTYHGALAVIRDNYEANYYECSAKQNIEVGPILDEILQQIVDQQPDDD